MAKNPGFLSNLAPAFALVPDREKTMQKDKSSQGIVLDEKAQEQPKDKERAQTVHRSEPGHEQRPSMKEDDELQPLREKSGF